MVGCKKMLHYPREVVIKRIHLLSACYLLTLNLVLHVLEGFLFSWFYKSMPFWPHQLIKLCACSVLDACFVVISAHACTLTSFYRKCMLIKAYIVMNYCLHYISGWLPDKEATIMTYMNMSYFRICLLILPDNQPEMYSSSRTMQ